MFTNKNLLTKCITVDLNEEVLARFTIYNVGKLLSRILSPAVLIPILTFIAIKSFSQTGDIIPPSPNIATLQRFGDYPVDHSTGLAEVKIPLYEIKMKGYSFPIDIKFHASGRRASLDFSPLGVGWALNSTGYISREVRERVDEQYQALEMSADSIENRHDQNIEHKYDLLIKADMDFNRPNDLSVNNLIVSEEEKIDAEHDIFSYSVNSLSGKFVIDKFGYTLPLTYSPIEIYGSGTGTISQFTIVDEKGFTYFFGGEGSIIETTYNSEGFSNYNFHSVNTGWFLKKITSPLGEEILFNYGVRNTESSYDQVIGSTNLWEQIDIGTEPMGVEGHSTSGSYGGRHVNSFNKTRNFLMSYLKEIIFPGGKVSYTYDSQTLRLNLCEIRDANNEVIKKVEFNYMNTPGADYLPNNNSVSLSSLVFQDKDGLPDATYVFEYYNHNLTSSYNYLNFSTKKDWWGYCNEFGNKIPYNSQADPMVNSGCNDCKAPNFYFKLNGMLKKINYPTGGNTEFVYEPNYYQGVSGIAEGPGIRIKEMITGGESSGSKVTKRYKYGYSEDGKGIISTIPNTEDFKFIKHYHRFYSGEDCSCIDYYLGAFSVTSYFLEPVVGMAEAYQQPIFYPQVTEYTFSENELSTGKTIYDYSVPLTEIERDYPMAFKKKYWTGAKLLWKDIYKYRKPQSDYSLVRTEAYEYEDYNYVSIPQVRVWRDWICLDLTYDNSTTERDLLDGLGNPQLPIPFSMKDIPIEAAVEKLSRQIIREYDDLGNLKIDTTEYFYDNTWHLEPTRTNIHTSRGDVLSVETSYTGDFEFSNPTDPAALGLENLKTKNIVVPIESSTYRMNDDGTNKRLISSQFSAFDAVKPLLLKTYQMELNSPIFDFNPAWVSSNTLLKDSRYTERQSFDSYDGRGNIQQQHASNGINISYLWGYDGRYPVAEIRNADIATVISALGGSGVVTNFTNNPNPSDLEVTNFLAPLKSGLPQAQMTTYTYKPLVGMTSMTDSKGLTTYYDYDGFQRLKLVKDSQGNILRTNDYHYKTQ